MRPLHLSVVLVPGDQGAKVPAVELRGVGKTFVSRQASIDVLSGVNLSLGDGEFVTIVGPSGSGKSTMLNLLAGLDHPSAGAVMCQGRRIQGVNTDIGYLTQHDCLLPWRTVEDNIAVPLEIRGLARSERMARVGIAQVGLEGFERHYPNQLSGGMRKRAMLARTLIYDPPILLMDEPFGPLDAQLKLTMQAELLKLWSARRKTVVFITHDIVEAITLADRVVVLSARPSWIKLDEQIMIPRPREVHEVRFHPSFEEHYRRLWGALDPTLTRSQS
ncbi:ABC transporter ATP-binding protein [Bradyrhizobium sp. AUGA SZCCT0431]|uniref:ABC transporter ATP-binding protein n=1 Tax=Bradyrhizobium sp. AUGA SZCCT0431 TaxID=2807674 RepID=UPI001BA9480F|nr:ABC transporter ATP-binding protein [Bradyrhizobium sp. AUGA SZCCT0431]MBR1142638.1 ABC transporter ATP-binding protein [Bradyrhizobium sp. AUGA SZCCT0431]